MSAPRRRVLPLLPLSLLRDAPQPRLLLLALHLEHLLAVAFYVFMCVVVGMCVVVVLCRVGDELAASPSCRPLTPVPHPQDTHKTKTKTSPTTHRIRLRSRSFSASRSAASRRSLARRSASSARRRFSSADSGFLIDDCRSAWGGGEEGGVVVGVGVVGCVGLSVVGVGV